jgi:hypothetical protein
LAAIHDEIQSAALLLGNHTPLFELLLLVDDEMNGIFLLIIIFVCYFSATAKDSLAVSRFKSFRKWPSHEAPAAISLMNAMRNNIS